MVILIYICSLIIFNHLFKIIKIMKLKAILKKEKKNSKTNFQKLDQKQSEKIIGGKSGDIEITEYRNGDATVKNS